MQEIDKFYYLPLKIGSPSFDSLVSREWLEADGLGGWSSSSLAHLNTRRYHGLLVSNEGGERRVLVSSFQEIALVGGSEIPLCSNKYPGVIHPDGWNHIQGVYTGIGFRTDFMLEGGVLTKEIVKRKGETSVGIRYSWSGPKSIELRILPFFAYRNFHCLQNRNSNPSVAVQKEDFGLSFCPFVGAERVYVSGTNMEVEDHFEWFINHEYEVERERGLDYSEDLFSLSRLTLKLNPNEWTFLVCSTKALRVSPEDWFDSSILQKKREFDAFEGDSFEDKLLSKSLSASLIQSSRGRKSIVAGYHWFEEWGRDTFISLPMMLDLFKSAEGVAEIFLDFLDNQKSGLIPNRFTGGSEDLAEYNSVDAGLWLVQAYYDALKHFQYPQDLLSLYPLVQSSMRHYMEGSLYGIRMLESGLITQGSAGDQLTWMDAKVDGVPITPREGLAVDINSLWYNALNILCELSKRLGDLEESQAYELLAQKVRAQFRATFMSRDLTYLFDTVNDGRKDLSFRPNQLFSISLSFSPMDQREARILLFNVRDKLLTTRGLRTLSREDSSYKSHFRGGPLERDSAYHQGTVWPWLFEYYRLAVMRYAEAELRPELEVFMDCFGSHILDEACVGSVSEVFDAEEPFMPGGTCSQTWSIGAIRAGRNKLLR